jgi:hypothetical protein
MKEMVQSHVNKIINKTYFVERRIQFQLATMTVKLQFYTPKVQYAATDPNIPSFRPYHSVLWSVLHIQMGIFFSIQCFLPESGGELFWKVPRLRPLVLHIAATCRWMNEYGAMVE